MNWKRASLTVLVLLPIIGLLGFGLTRDPKQIDSPLPGRPAPAFSLGVFAPGEGKTALAVGDTVSLAGHQGRVMVVNFWASWCLQCRDEHRDLSETATAYFDRGVRFVGVLYNDQESFGRRWIEEMGGQTYPSVLDPRTRTAIDYGLYGVPETFIISQDGRVAYKHIGPITAGLLSYKIDSLLQSGTGTP
jgi:cytochrome c biogenesis protein CcmG/thiol:disulfide interchange protein DsbE